MDTTHNRPKPATAPKPVTRFSNPKQDERNVGIKERNSLVRCKQEETEVVGLISGNDGVITVPVHCASAIPLPPKPALLPKPQSPLKPCIRGRPQFSQLPRHSNAEGLQPSGTQDHLTEKTKGPPLSLLKIKAPVAKLDEFDSLYDPVTSPVRPPRSPKIKIFPEGPFKASEEKPELPVKKRLLGPGTVTDREAKDWERVKKRSSSLGRMGNTSLLEKRGKSLSLSRNLCPSEAFCASKDTPLCTDKIGPVPPPRRHKKSEEMLNNCTDLTTLSHPPVPVYAQVNYEMKKNRREVVSAPTPSSQHDKEAVEEIITGQLLLAGDKIERNHFIQIVDTTHTPVESADDVDNCAANVNIFQGDKSAESVVEQGSPEPITEFGVILQDKENEQVHIEKAGISVDDLGVTLVIKQQCTEDSAEHKLKTSMCEDVTENLVPQHSTLHCIMKESILQASQVAGASSSTRERIYTTLDPRKSEFIQESMLHVSHVTDAPSTDSKIIAHLEPRKSKLYNLQHVPTARQDTAPSNDSFQHVPAARQDTAPNNDMKRYSASITTRKSELYTLQQSPSTQQDTAARMRHTSNVAEETVIPSLVAHTATDAAEASPKDTDTVVQGQGEDVVCLSVSSKDSNHKPVLAAKVSEVSSLVSAGGRTETMTEKVTYFEAAPPPSGSVLKGKWDETGKIFRRQSWSSSKDTTPSPDRESARKQKHNSAQTAWCDDGELSNGALADSDTGSSDNTGKKSVEDMANGSGPYVRSKIASWFDSFGKGSKRKERKIRANSSFYNEEKALGTSSSTGSKSPLPEPAEIRIGSGVEFLRPDNLVVGVVRSPSGVSSILDNMEPATTLDSESDNEEHTRRDSSPLSEEQRKERKAFLIAQELMTSERQFVAVLQLLNIDFIDAVNAAGTKEHPVIPPHELTKISNSLPQLQRLNEVILRDLELRIKDWKLNPKIADVIVQKGPFLKLYSSYIRNFEIQCNNFDECCHKYPHFGKAVKVFEASPICKKLEVKHFMLKPVQRIPQYRMLLEDYQRNLTPNSADFADTEAALKIVREVADHANRTIKLGDHLIKLIDLQSQMIDYEIIKPGRVYLKDGELFKLSRKVRHPRYFILLNDCLLYTTRLSTSFLRVNTELPLDGMKVFIPQVEDNLNEFNIISVTRSFTLSATSLAERQEWIEALENAIKDHTSRKLSFLAAKVDGLNVSEPLKLGHQAPVWIQDARVTMCQSCTTPFTVMFRRHHCRACGKVVCGHCSDNRAPLRYKGFQSERVCEDCHQTLLQEFEGPESKSILQDIMNEGGFKDLEEAFEVTKNMFKKSGSGTKKKILLKKDIPQRLKEVAANDSGSQMSGWLQRRGRRSWKRLWFVLKDQVLYVYKASEDVVALESIPVLGYKVEPMTERHFQIYEGIDATLVFQLAHSGQLPLVFHADSQYLANRWMASMEEATVLH